MNFLIFYAFQQFFSRFLSEKPEIWQIFISIPADFHLLYISAFHPLYICIQAASYLLSICI